MKEVVFIMEKTEDGFSAYAEAFPVYTTGTNIDEITSNALEAINLYCGEKSLKKCVRENIMIK
jgi:predicted RNase H-like HicB family nuclease